MKVGETNSVTIGQPVGTKGVYNVTPRNGPFLPGGCRNVAQDNAPDQRDRIPYGTVLPGAIWDGHVFLVFYTGKAMAAKGAD